MGTMRTYNVEAGFPVLDEARRLVIEEIKKAKHEGVKVLKVIHGYGSSGKGGTLCVGLRRSFGLRKKEGVIKDFVAGEEFAGTWIVDTEALVEIAGGLEKPLHVEAGVADSVERAAELGDEDELGFANGEEG